MRRRARECALQLLYQLDISGCLIVSSYDEEKIQTAMTAYWSNFEQVSEAEKTFTERLVSGVIRECEHIDTLIRESSINWKLQRMDKVDRNVLRVACFEIIYCPDIPAAVSINEAIEIAKRYSNQSSAPFINGILDQLSAKCNTS